ncbi:MAG: hypothetical protein AAGF67_14000 [Verrucomicrobiota bacterium]
MKSRRAFLLSSGSALSASTLRAETTPSSWPPRLLYNNDGNDSPEQPVTAASFLAARTQGLEKSGIDAVAYCTGGFNHYTHRSELSQIHDYDGPVEGPNQTSFRWVTDLHTQGLDPIELVQQFSHENGRPCFWSMRMNDTHDSRSHIDRPHAENPWKEAHRDLLMRPEPQPMPWGWFLARSWNWSAVDYEHEEVRALVFRIVEDVITRFQLDGIELDFTRFPIYFRPQTEGKSVPQASANLMTSLVAKIRRLLDETAKESGRTHRLIVRIPDSIDFCREIGLDVTAWLKQGLPDLIVAGGDFQLRPWSEIVESCHKHNKPVLASLNATSIGFDPKAWRQLALDAWEQGVDGIATFNFFHPDHSLMDQLHDPEKCRSNPRIDRYELSPLNQKMIRSLSTLVKGGERFLHPSIRERWINPPEFFRS